jgi:uncharacterized repeat protein (TIGR04076 family)
MVVKAVPNKVVPQAFRLSLIFQGQAFLLPKGKGGAAMRDEFTLFDLKVEVVATEKPMVCSHKEGEYFLVEGENLVFPQTQSFSMYALGALLPMLPAKQRPLHPNDWMLSDSLIACPDPNCGALFKIVRTGTRTLSHAACTTEPICKGEEENDKPL